MGGREPLPRDAASILSQKNYPVKQKPKNPKNN